MGDLIPIKEAELQLMIMKKPFRQSSRSLKKLHSIFRLSDTQIDPLHGIEKAACIGNAANEI